jgi:hypothetical protein
MNIKKISLNITSVIVLFLAFIRPINDITFTDYGYNVIVRVTSFFCFGMCDESEAGDLNANATLLVSIALSITVVFLVNLIIKRHRRKNSNVK